MACECISAQIAHRLADATVSIWLLEALQNHQLRMSAQDLVYSRPHKWLRFIRSTDMPLPGTMHRFNGRALFKKGWDCQEHAAASGFLHFK